MAKTATQNPDSPKDDETLSIQRLPDTAKSDAHVAQLLQIGEFSAKWLWMREEIGGTTTVDPVLATESKKTFELVNLRLRDLVDETRRWSLDPTAAEKETTKLVDSTLELYRAKTENAQLHNRPSLFLRPKIAKFENVGWVAWLGEGPPLKQHLHGIGASPELAFEAFDKCYRTHEKIADAQPPAPPPAPAPAPSSKPVRKTRNKK
jgi:hypothetical protein